MSDPLSITLMVSTLVTSAITLIGTIALHVHMHSTCFKDCCTCDADPIEESLKT